MSDLAVAIVTALSCLGVLLLFFFIWLKQFKVLYKVIFFLFVYIALAGSSILLDIFMVVKADDPNFEWVRKLGMWVTVGACIWYGAWCSQYKMDKEEGIARKID